MQRSAWDFALEGWVLRKLGLTNHDLAWLLCKGFVAQAHELPPTDQGRSFVRVFKPICSNRACFVATQLGVDFIIRALDENASGGDRPTGRVVL